MFEIKEIFYVNDITNYLFVKESISIWTSFDCLSSACLSALTSCKTLTSLDAKVLDVVAKLGAAALLTGLP